MFFQRITRLLIPLTLLALLFLATTAQRSGGFGGGRGGGGFSGGGFRSGGGGFRSGGGGGFRGPTFFGGPRFFYFGRGPGLGFILVIIGGIAVVVLVAGAVNWANSRYVTVGLALNLRDGKRYSKRLDDLLQDSDFTDPSGRARALHRISKAVDISDIADGFATVSEPFSGKDAAGGRAESLARQHMNYLGITADAVNIASPEGTGVKLDSAPQTAPGDAYADACVLSLIATVRRGAMPGLQSGGEKESIALLARFAGLSGKNLDALYFFYVPHAPQPLDSISANRIFLDLRAAVHA